MEFLLNCFPFIGLQPFTSYNLRVQACTIIGCGTSDSTQTITLEATPEGIINLTLISRTSTTLTVRISPISKPNGLITYTLYAAGVFNGSQDMIMAVYSSIDSGDVVVTNLLPFNLYTVYLDINNTVGGIRSDQVIFETLGAGEQRIMFDFMFLKCFSITSVVNLRKCVLLINSTGVQTCISQC